VGGPALTLPAAFEATLAQHEGLVQAARARRHRPRSERPQRPAGPRRRQVLGSALF
jgi:hypothetical protein